MLTQAMDAVKGGRSLVFSVRASATKESLDDQPWRRIGTETFSLELEDRCLQYQTLFISDNGDRYAVLDRVSIMLTTGP